MICVMRPLALRADFFIVMSRTESSGVGEVLAGEQVASPATGR
jgi:hypothetical protein